MSGTPAHRSPVLALDLTKSGGPFNAVWRLDVEAAMPGYQPLAFGHSTGGPMSMFLYRFLKTARVIGIVGWGSGGPYGW